MKIRRNKIKEKLYTYVIERNVRPAGPIHERRVEQ